MNNILKAGCESFIVFYKIWTRIDVKRQLEAQLSLYRSPNYLYTIWVKAIFSFFWELNNVLWCVQIGIPIHNKIWKWQSNNYACTVSIKCIFVFVIKKNSYSNMVLY